MGKEYLQNSSVFEAAICVTVHIHALNINANSLLICSLWLCHIDLSTSILACISKTQFWAASKWKKQGKYHSELHDDVNTLEPDGYEQLVQAFPDVLLLGSPALQGEAAIGGGVGEGNTLTFSSHNRRYERILLRVYIFLHKFSYAQIQKYLAE